MAANQMADKSSSLSNEFSKLKVLVVEDNVLHMAVFKEQLLEFLHVHEANIVFANDGEEGLAALESSVY